MSTLQQLSLCPPQRQDVPELHRIFADPRVWSHAPAKRHASVEKTMAMVEAWRGCWRREGLGPWVIRAAGSRQIIGYGGCSLTRKSFWNLGYRFAVSAQGQGFATQVARQAVGQANRHRPEAPVVASLLEHNAASARVAQKLGFTLAYRGPDRGNPDAQAIRLIYADRALEGHQLELMVG
ncbi:GNAT family N-acetyltransferase [Glutamicibacter creatinolyticus]|uniref:GNAT family N-acetyltransferase n=1 Tax=Glutamicibacter creatinolyticus TaxID=162496 RepID=UPI0037BEB265